MKSTVVDESLSSFKPMYCSREYQASTRLSQQYEKSTSNYTSRIWDTRPGAYLENGKGCSLDLQTTETIESSPLDVSTMS